ncbi:DUF167 domain-containing protein [Lyticum sinuosum]|uniref:DUF167 domain-containing protein n=1 Tax=Lyticum sinuosum TaxID=1332059 RepID=UPI002ACDBDAC|nr:DUF167 domain-containing protein [Lyticum sinuosum]
MRLIPKSSKNFVADFRYLDNGQKQMIIYVTEPPDKGLANKRMLKMLAEYYKIPVSCIKLIRGHTTKNKIVQLIM